MEQTPTNRPGIKIFGKARSALGYMLRDFLHRSDVPFEWIELTTDDDARAKAGVESLHDSRLPVCVFPDGVRMQCPSIRQISEKLGWSHDPSRSEYDLAIYGAGPAGLSAAVYGASEGLRTIVVERLAVGGQASSSSKIENYLGFPSGISGAELAERAREQACKFGAELLIGREGIRGEFVPGKGVGYLADGTKIIARSTICATGVEYRRLNVPDESRFLGAGVYYGAGASEAMFCGNEDVFVVGGGNSAGQAAMHFSQIARTVTIVVLESSLVNMSRYLIDRVESAPNIQKLTNSVVSALGGDEVLNKVTITSCQTHKQQTFATRWLFVCIGGVPRTDWAEAVGIVRDDAGYLITGPSLIVNGPSPRNWPLDRHP